MNDIDTELVEAINLLFDAANDVDVDENLYFALKRLESEMLRLGLREPL